MWNTLILSPMINTLLFIYDALGNNFGLAIILLTVIIRLITLPLTYQQMKSTMVMSDIQKSDRWQQMQKKYKDDRQKLAEEQMKLFQEKGYNPASGCLPLLIQFPIIIGLYQAVIRTLGTTPVQLFDLSKLIYDFIPNSLIPLESSFLWMNLGQPERLYLPFLPNIGIPLLAILVVITSYLQTKLTTPATGDSQSAAMTQTMSIYMPLLIGYLAYSFASGVALYFVTSNLLGIVQGLIMRRMRSSEA
ncbi:MAG: YidC/Oxa1 family membrane protein insertase [Anaerolineales bacterium]|jgi:YidC/Oxa1 family membrane protein insertase